MLYAIQFVRHVRGRRLPDVLRTMTMDSHSSSPSSVMLPDCFERLSSPRERKGLSFVTLMARRFFGGWPKMANTDCNIADQARKQGAVLTDPPVSKFD
jgi:hypothetical protein